MGKRSVYTKITPLPANVPRQLALDMLHSHAEVIQLNPLVTGVTAIDAPRDAAADEFFSQWYEISEIITWGPGLKKRINFRGVFHDQPWGLQSHVYAPMGTDLRNKYRIGGNQPGEPREPKELGVDTPVEGLYLREDVEIICSVPLTMGFVKKETKAATGTMIDRLTKKAELLDEGKLHAMFENGKLKTSKPNQAPTFVDRPLPSPGSEMGSGGPASPGLRSDSASIYSSPAQDQQGFGNYHDIVGRHNSHRFSSYVPGYQQNGYNGPDYAKPPLPEINELPGSFYHPEQQSPGLYPPPLKPQGQSFRSELPGDYTLAPPPLSAAKRRSTSTMSSQHHPSPQPSPGLPHRSPLPSPALPDRRTSTTSSTYAITNPDPAAPLPYPHHHPHRNSTASAHSGAPNDPISERHRHHGSAPPEEDPPTQRPSNAARAAAAAPSQILEPDHQRFSHLSIQGRPYESSAAAAAKGEQQDAGAGAGTVSQCPVCGLFEGDEAAVTHHVSKAHFA